MVPLLRKSPVNIFMVVIHLISPFLKDWTTVRNKVIPEPGRIRKVSKSFGWLDHRLLREGWLEKLSLQEIAVYTFLVLAADRNGVSWYSREKIARVVGLDTSVVSCAIEGLDRLDLIAFKGFSPRNPNGFYQVLNVPAVASNAPPTRNEPPERIGEIIQRLSWKGQ